MVLIMVCFLIFIRTTFYRVCIICVETYGNDEWDGVFRSDAIFENIKVFNTI